MSPQSAGYHKQWGSDSGTPLGPKKSVGKRIDSLFPASIGVREIPGGLLRWNAWIFRSQLGFSSRLRKGGIYEENSFI
jgi:hypothetical protein